MIRMLLAVFMTLAATPALAAPANAPAAVIRPPVTIDEAQRARGIVRTSVDYGDRNGLGGEAGFICGRQDIAVKDGAAGAYGNDPDGRLLGARLRLRFR